MNKSEDYYIVRTNRAGVFFGKIKEKNGSSVTLNEVRKLFYWAGAAAVEQLAVDGTSRPNDCKFTVVVDELEVLDAIEIMKCTEKSAISIKAVREWKY